MCPFGQSNQGSGTIDSMNFFNKQSKRPIARRPRDLINLLISLGITLAVVGIGALAARTTAGLDQDLTIATRELPGFVIFILNTIGATAIIFVPVIVTFSLLTRNRTRQLIDALLASGISVLLLIGLSILIIQSNSPRLILAMTGGLQTQGVSPLDPLIAGLISFLIIARVFDKGRLGFIAIISVFSLVFVSSIAGQTTIVAQIANILLGWSVGLAVRYVLGTPINRASEEQIKEGIEADGLKILSMDFVMETTEARIFKVKLSSNKELNVWVFDWELQGSGVISSWLRGLFLKTSGDFRGMSIRRRVERTALIAHAISAVGVKIPEVEMVREIEPDSIFIALENIDGKNLSDLAKDNFELSESQIEEFFQNIKKLHNADIVHRALSAENIFLTDKNIIALTAVHSGAIAATEVQQRIDLAESLVTMARVSSVQKTINIAKKVFKTSELTAVIPALQKVAMSRKTRNYLKNNKNLLLDLRKGLGELASSAEIEPIQFQRVNWRNAFLAFFSVFALYILVPQFSQVNFSELLAKAQWQWAAIALISSTLTYIASTSLLLAFVIQKVNWLKTFRFLNKSGVSTASSATAVGASQVIMFFIHVIFLVITGVIAGAQTDLSFRPPRITLFIFVVLFAIIIVALSFNRVRNWVISKTRPIYSQVGPTLAIIFQQPRRLVVSLTSSVLLNIFYIISFYASLKAFNAEVSFFTIAFVYLAGATIGQAAPTPGGIGAVEATLVAGLTATGVPSALALSGVLLYRIATFYIRVLPGWFAFIDLQRKNLI
ncbi:MAG: TIGR00374 family protein [Actinobacteria bacterium]|nr:TIGR00374 family protein [Actinomycetota bacterium]